MDGRSVEVEVEQVVEEALGLRLVEAELCLTKLGQFPRRSPAPQRQRRIGARHEHDPKRIRPAVDQARQQLVAAGVGDPVVVIEDQRRPAPSVQPGR